MKPNNSTLFQTKSTEQNPMVCQIQTSGDVTIQFLFIQPYFMVYTFPSSDSTSNGFSSSSSDSISFFIACAASNKAPPFKILLFAAVFNFSFNFSFLTSFSSVLAFSSYFFGLSIRSKISANPKFPILSLI